MEHIIELIKTITSEIENISKTENLIGDPITIEGKTFFPLIRLRIGLAVTGLAGKALRNSSEDTTQIQEKGAGKLQGGGAAGGMKITPLAMVYLDDKQVKILPLPGKKKALTKFLEKIPDVIEKIQEKLLERQKKSE